MIEVLRKTELSVINKNGGRTKRKLEERETQEKDKRSRIDGDSEVKSFMDTPVEIQAFICSFLTVKDALRVSMVCKQLHEVLHNEKEENQKTDTREIWHKIYLNTFGPTSFKTLFLDDFMSHYSEEGGTCRKGMILFDCGNDRKSDEDPTDNTDLIHTCDMCDDGTHKSWRQIACEKTFVNQLPCPDGDAPLNIPFFVAASNAAPNENFLEKGKQGGKTVFLEATTPAWVSTNKVKAKSGGFRQLEKLADPDSNTPMDDDVYKQVKTCFEKGLASGLLLGDDIYWLDIFPTDDGGANIDVVVAFAYGISASGSILGLAWPQAY